ELALGESVLVKPLREFLAGRPQKKWEGTATDLLEKLNDATDMLTTSSKDWPKKPNGLTGKLRRLAPNLRKSGLNITIQHTEEGSLVKLVLTAPTDKKRVSTPRVRGD